MQAFKVEQQQATTQLQQRLDAAEQACQERDQTLQRFKEAMGSDTDAAALQAYQAEVSSNAAQYPQPGQLSPVQSYSQYVNLLHEHNKLKREHAKLQDEWQQVTCSPVFCFLDN